MFHVSSILHPLFVGNGSQSYITDTLNHYLSYAVINFPVMFDPGNTNTLEHPQSSSLGTSHTHLVLPWCPRPPVLNFCYRCAHTASTKASSNHPPTLSAFCSYISLILSSADTGQRLLAEAGLVLNGSCVSSGSATWQTRADGAVLVGVVISDGEERSVKMEGCLSELELPMGKEQNSSPANDKCQREKLWASTLRNLKLFQCRSLVDLHDTPSFAKSSTEHKEIPFMWKLSPSLESLIPISWRFSQSDPWDR